MGVRKEGYKIFCCRSVEKLASLKNFLLIFIAVEKQRLKLV